MKKNGTTIILRYRCFVKFALFFFCPFQSILAECHVLFSPEDRPTMQLIKLINEAQKKIHAAVYMLTDKNIANALIKAHKRNVDVQIIVDKITMDSIYGKGKMLKEQGVKVFVFEPITTTHKTMATSYRRQPALMHNKFVLFDKIIWTGSFNWTHSANQQNQENVILTDDKHIYSCYEKHFEQLKQKCYLRTIENPIDMTILPSKYWYEHLAILLQRFTRLILPKQNEKFTNA